MEVADHWRREWAGTAEFGKITEGGVTRQVARAMEVLHASAPGARMRVMRAAYHSTAGPGIPASSFMLHSSRRVISSGFNLLESPSIHSKPLEISSTPLESFPGSTTENYKVTEPDDTEISEPSKWRASSSGSTLRMPSEESSSTDNASIIDLDNRSHRNSYRKYSYDSENSDFPSSRRSSARASPLLDAPVTLSTLKYKSLLNSSNDWNKRRKSYSFEDTCPSNETILHSNDILAMESSTDSGICKSTEIVNNLEDDKSSHSFGKANKYTGGHDETFKDWLHKNRPITVSKNIPLKPRRQHDIVIEEPAETNISLKYPGKVCITVPIMVEKDNYAIEDSDRKVKKVEFCKTELHFAAESGKVNIIATDEKPPPTSDFRKRRSVFGPITDKFGKPVILFGEKRELSDTTKNNEFPKYDHSDPIEDEIENTAATKSILKNKIPKPKPYLLGENTVLGNSDSLYSKDQSNDFSATSGVLLINKQLESERKYSDENISTFTHEDDVGKNNKNIKRTINNGPRNHESPSYEKNEIGLQFENATPKVNTIKNKIIALPISPISNAKTRQLRESDLTYFGIDKDIINSVKERAIRTENTLSTHNNISDTIFQSVKLIKRISNSACNSEAESEDTPEYQNIILKTDTSKPTPKPRSKYNADTERNLQPITEQFNTKSSQESRRSRSKKYEEIVVPTPRSRSEPAKKQTAQELYKTEQLYDTHADRISPSARSKRPQNIESRRRKPSPIKRDIHKIRTCEGEAPLYVNLKAKNEYTKGINLARFHESEMTKHISAEATHNNGKIKRKESLSPINKKSPEIDKGNTINKAFKVEDSLEKRLKSTKKSTKIHRTKKLVTPEQSLCDQAKNNELTENKINETKRFLENGAGYNRNTKREQKTNSYNRKPLAEKHVDLKRDAMIRDKDKHILNDIAKETNHSTKSDKNYKIPVNGDYKRTSSGERRSHKDITNRKKIVEKPMRNEYIINYDDKNGTVSSICKIKSVHSQSNRKPVIKEKNKENPDYKEIKHRTIEKTSLLQQQQWNRNGMKQGWTLKNRIQRSCQLL